MTEPGPAGRTWEFPGWFTKLLVAAVLGYFGWQAQRVVVKLDALSERVGVIEERVPQPLSKELAPLTDEVQKLALELSAFRRRAFHSSRFARGMTR